MLAGEPGLAWTKESLDSQPPGVRTNEPHHHPDGRESLSFCNALAKTEGQKLLQGKMGWIFLSARLLQWRRRGVIQTETEDCINLTLSKADGCIGSQ